MEPNLLKQKELIMTRMCVRLLICGLMIGLVAGCATTPKKSDDDLIKETVATVKTALEAKDIEMLLTTFSEDFSHPELAGGKEEAREMLQMGVDAGYADDGEVSIVDMQITKNDDGTASVYPVDLSGPPGSISVELVMKKEGDVWRIVTVNPDGM